MDTGDGNDIITGTTTNEGYGIFNEGYITTGDGNDIITGIGSNASGIYNYSGIHNEGTINTGNGADSIIADGGFDSCGVIGSVFLGNGKDYIKGFGRGIFKGGNGEDTLELTSGSYTIEISETAVNFTQPSSRPWHNGKAIMITSEFEKLIVGNTTYDFSSLTNGQTIVVA